PGVTALGVPYAWIGDSELTHFLARAKERVNGCIPQGVADAGHGNRARPQPQQAHRNAKCRRPDHVLRHLAEWLSEFRIDDRHGEMPQAESKTCPDDNFCRSKSGPCAASPQRPSEKTFLGDQR